jgi:hypothetical protein
MRPAPASRLVAYLAGERLVADAMLVVAAGLAAVASAVAARRA